MEKKEPPDDLDRLLQETLTELGHDADAATLARRVRRLDYGLPAEDEFSVVCAWLGKCRLIHKLDQQQTPKASKDKYQVPDLLAVFEEGGPFVVEVKVSSSRTLSLKPAYYEKLLAYADLLGRPLLIAWKFHSLWILVDVRHLKLARTNYNISHGEAMRQNLMGVLAGDVAYKLAPGAGLHFDFAKEELVNREETEVGVTETWHMRVSDAYFTDGEGKRRTDQHSETFQLLTTWPLEESEEHSETSIAKSFVVGDDDQVQFAHVALVHLLSWESPVDGKPHWRSLLRAPQITRSIGDFRAALLRGLDEGMVRYVLDQRPVDTPDFLGS